MYKKKKMFETKYSPRLPCISHVYLEAFYVHLMLGNYCFYIFFLTWQNWAENSWIFWSISGPDRMVLRRATRLRRTRTKVAAFSRSRSRRISSFPLYSEVVFSHVLRQDREFIFHEDDNRKLPCILARTAEKLRQFILQQWVVLSALILAKNFIRLSKQYLCLGYRSDTFGLPDPDHKIFHCTLSHHFILSTSSNSVRNLLLSVKKLPNWPQKCNKALRYSMLNLKLHLRSIVICKPG